MKLIVGLGNPGRRYAGTRHNIGFDILDLLARRHGAAWEAGPRGIEALIARWRPADVVLAKPLTFMNLSGAAVVALLQFYKIDPVDLLVVVDDVNIDLGRIRARPGGSAGGQRGGSEAGARGGGAATFDGIPLCPVSTGSKRPDRRRRIRLAPAPYLPLVR